LLHTDPLASNFDLLVKGFKVRTTDQMQG